MPPTCGMCRTTFEAAAGGAVACPACGAPCPPAGIPTPTTLERRAQGAMWLGILSGIPPVGLFAFAAGRGIRRAIRAGGAAGPCAAARAAAALWLGGAFTLLHAAGAYPAWAWVRDRRESSAVALCAANASAIREALTIFTNRRGEGPASVEALAASVDCDPSAWRCPACGEPPPHYALVPSGVEGVPFRIYERHASHRAGRTVVDRNGTRIAPEEEVAAALRLLDPAHRMSRGRGFEDAGNFEGALREYDSAAALAPGDPAARLAAARAASRMEDWEGALRRCEEGLDDGRPSPPLRAMRGIALARLGRLDEASAELEPLAQSPPVPPEAYLGLAQLREAYGDPFAAAQEYLRFLDEAPAGHPERTEARKAARRLARGAFEWTARERMEREQSLPGLAELGRSEIAQAAGFPAGSRDRATSAARGLARLAQAADGLPDSCPLAAHCIAGCGEAAWMEGLPAPVRRDAVALALRLFPRVQRDRGGLDEADRTRSAMGIMLCMYFAGAYPIAADWIQEAEAGAWCMSEEERGRLDALRGTIRALGQDLYSPGEPVPLHEGTLLTPYVPHGEAPEGEAPRDEILWIAVSPQAGVRAVYALASHPDRDGRRFYLFRRDRGEDLMRDLGTQRPSDEEATQMAQEAARADLAARPYAPWVRTTALDEARDLLEEARRCIEELGQ